MFPCDKVNNFVGRQPAEMQLPRKAPAGDRNFEGCLQFWNPLNDRVELKPGEHEQVRLDGGSHSCRALVLGKKGFFTKIITADQGGQFHFSVALLLSDLDLSLVDNAEVVRIGALAKDGCIIGRPSFLELQGNGLELLTRPIMEMMHPAQQRNARIG